MPYLVASLTVTNTDTAELAVAMLADAGFDSFEETDTGLNAYIDAQQYDAAVLQEIVSGLQSFGIQLVSVLPLEEKNWNEEWEKNFEPITVEDYILVRAPFHTVAQVFPYVITIEPKMAFGTGHHETTWLMLRQMLQLPMQGKRVFDFGCGTGILAIMAAKQGAKSIVAIDNDEWAYHSTIENAGVNHTPQIEARLGNHTALQSHEQFEVILANINRNVILETLPALQKALTPQGILLVSGILATDVEQVTQAAQQCGFTLLHAHTRGNWAMLHFLGA